jgi:hypothetical protein
MDPRKPFIEVEGIYKRGVWVVISSENLRGRPGPERFGIVHAPSGLMLPVAPPFRDLTSDEAINACRILGEWNENFLEDAPFGQSPSEVPPDEVIDTILDMCASTIIVVQL